MNALKNVVLCLSFIGFALVSCSQEMLDTNPESLLGRWEMIKVIQDDSSIVKPKILDQGVEIEFLVEVEFLPEGKIKGIVYRNPMIGAYEVKNSDSVSIRNYSKIKFSEPVWGDYFTKAIEEVSTYKISSDLLYLNYFENQLIFRRME